MRVVTSLVMLLVAIGSAEAQSPEPPLSDTRIAVHTLVREDVFAGFLSNDMVRFARAERNIQQLLKDRPDQRGNLLAWTGGAALYRSVLAHESGNNGEFLKLLQAARTAFAEAAKAGPAVAKFFDDVMVMADDAKLRDARLRLLRRLEGLILQLADVSEIVPEEK